jgi:serralysin
MPSRVEPRRRQRGVLFVLAVTALMAFGATPASASQANVISFDTPQPPMLNNLVGGGTVDPLVTVGEQLGSVMFEALPDGISVIKRKPGSIDMLINHETSTVPFPYNNPPSASNLNDFQDSLVSNLRLKISTRTITRARYIINDGQNFHRFCSNFLAGPAQGFDRKILMTNEEGTDWVNKDGLQWPATVGADSARQIGAVIARDTTTGETRPIWGMGRHNHENSLALTGYNVPIVLSGDDTFLTNPASSQLYMYGAGSATDLFNDNGTLYAFVSDTPTVNDYYDFPPGTGMAVSGKFIPVPKVIATGKNPDGTDMVGSEVPASVGGPYPAPAAGEMTNSAGTTTPVDGPQWILEHWGDLNNVFSFVRLEDMAYDKRPGMGNVVYMIDSGRGQAGAAPAAGLSTNGRVWKLVLDPNDPATVWSLSVLIEGDDNPVKTLTEVRQPDNIESTMNGLYITEDPGSSQQFAPADAAGVNARVWQYRFSDSSLNPVLEINQSADEGPTDVDTSGPGNKGSWEASGIIDVSKYFGAGYFLIDVQAHTLFTQTQPGPDVAAPAGPDWTYKREGGQLLLVYIPGA